MDACIKPYCCQNAVINLINHMIPVPDSFPVNPVCLSISGLDEADFIAGLKKLTKIVRSVYENIIETPEQYGLPLVADIKYPVFNAKARDSMNSCKRLPLILMNLAKAGQLNGSRLEVSVRLFNELNQSLKSKDKLSNVPMVLGKLNDFGFCYDGFDGKRFKSGIEHFFVEYPNSSEIMRVLKGYMEVAYNSNDLYPLLYSLAIDPIKRPRDQQAKDFAEFLSGEDKAFFLTLHSLLDEIGLMYRPSGSYSYAFVYLDPKKKDQKTDDEYYVRFFSEKELHVPHDKRRDVVLRLRSIAKFSDRISELPVRIKSFLTETTCKHCFDECSNRLSWTVDEQTYEACSYWNFTMHGLKESDAYAVAELVKLEMESVKKQRNAKR